MRVIFFFLILSFNSFAQEFSVRFDDLENIKAFASKASASPMSITIEKPSGGGIGNAESDQVLAWMPVNGVDSQSNFSVISTPANLPDLNANGDAYFFVDLQLTNLDVQDLIVNIAVKNSDGDYKAFPLSNILADKTVSANSSKSQRVIFKLTSICGVDSSDYCNNSTTIAESYNLYIYMSTSEDNNVTVTTADKGLFLNLKTSNVIPSNNFTLNSVQRGDGRLFADVQGGSAISQMGEDFLRTEVFSYGNQVEQAAQSIGAGGATSLYQIPAETIAGTFDNGEIRISGLTNNTAYNVSATKVNKFLFAATLSNSLVGTPETIEALLQNEACYLLSAGFQREHKVINYFRYLRDEFLLKSSLGTLFVEWYYRTAPNYTKQIMESSFLSAIIVGIGYIAYYLIQYFWIIVGFGGILFFTRQFKFIKE